MLEALAVFPPLAAAIIVGLFGRRALGDRASQLITCGGVLLSAAVAIWLFVTVALGHNPHTIHLFRWFSSGTFEVDWALRLDTLSVVMITVVTVVSSMVHIYSVGYMAHDRDIPRFMAYLSLFTFMMLALVTADNFLQMFFGWEGVGLASYLLIGFWYDRPAPQAAAIKAFVVNRVGDFGFTLGIMAVYFIFDSVQFDPVFAAAAGKVGMHFSFLGTQADALATCCLLLFVGAMGKSAQLGLHTWLPDAMEGPTPVSALIHAATMVTAGVFMLARCSPLFEQSPMALEVVTVVGALTAFVAATIGLTQFDIKRVIAYSTMSQLGYMFFAIGVSAYSAAIFHLMTHAFFKALLFLGAGSVIHALSGEQDMRKMGGLMKVIPKTGYLMWIGSLALAGIGIPGIFGFAGFYSKDMILEAAYQGGGVGQFAYWLGVIAAFFTAFYSWRLIIMTFYGAPRADHHTMEHAHESPPVMLLPLTVLAAGALLAGWAGYDFFVGEGREAFWGSSIFVAPSHDSIELAHKGPEWVGVVPLIAGLLGVGLAYVFYMFRPRWPAAWVEALGPLHQLIFRKYYFDELYDLIVVRPALWFGRMFWQKGDVGTIDAYGPDGIASGTRSMAGVLSRLQTGYLFHYALAMLVGVLILTTFYIVLGGV
ncbi:MAG TPA: NADH-quinone oxidoreductase subunit L [Alphaproteobacteria bacterium]|jgi:NADH-quinone oxidoreductase subunit L|nr:NADH-quinone oxidoreductase subunit L [Alphaproteobacteria bacterium]